MKWMLLCSWVAFCSACHMNKEQMDKWWIKQICKSDEFRNKTAECSMMCPEQVLSIVQNCSGGNDIAEAFRGMCSDPETREQKWKDYDRCAKEKLFSYFFGTENCSQEMIEFPEWRIPRESEESASTNGLQSLMEQMFQGEDLTKMLAACVCFQSEMNSYWESNKPSSCEE